MSIRRRTLVVVIWALSAFCIVLIILLIIGLRTVTYRAAVHPPRSTGNPTHTPSFTPTPSPTATNSGGTGPNQSGGVGVGTGGGTGTAPINQPTASYIIGGALPQQLQPGDSYPLNLTLSNQSGVAITVVDLSVTISRVTAPNASASLPCTVSDFSAAQIPGGFSMTLGAFEVTSLSARGIPSSQWPQIRMINTVANQDGCKGASLTLTFTGSSTVGP